MARGETAFRVRDETAADAGVIGELTAIAFEGHPHSDGSEPRIIERLRRHHALTMSLVAELHGRILGHVAFSPASNDSGVQDWFALGPVSVAPEVQKQGIGTTLIEAGLARLREMDAAGCILVGDPAYYSRFGFRVTPEHCPAGLPGDYFMTISFGVAPTGTFNFHPAFFGPLPS